MNTGNIIIECPNCGTKYKVREEAIKPRGRTVHCNQCSNRWHVEPSQTRIDEWEDRFQSDPMIETTAEREEADHATHSGEAETAAEVFEHAAASLAPLMPAAESDAESGMIAAAPKIVSEPDHSHSHRLASLGLLAASVAILAIGLFSMRTKIERAFPASARLYQAAGVENAAAPGAGLLLQDVHAYLTTEATGQQLTIEAKVVNPQKTPVVVPALVASLITVAGQSRHWTFDAATPKLGPEAVTTVKASFDGANTENGKILLTFSADNSGQMK